MRNRGPADGYPHYFLLLYAATYMTNAVFNTFFPVYLDHLGFSRTLIGTMLALGPLVAIVAQPVWGIVGDRAGSKNSVLKLLLLGSALTVLLYPLSNHPVYIIILIALFTFFQSSVNPLSDAITLESLESTRWKFGPIRMAGTLGFALMSVVAGRLADWKIGSIFPLYFLLALAGFLSVYRLPRIRGHQSKGPKVSPLLLFKNRGLVLLLAFHFVIQATFGFYYSFFPIYFKQLGADSTLLGVAMLITSTSEVPFLLFADRILAKLGVRLTMILSACIIAVRWMLLHAVVDKHAVLAVNATHGLTFIVFAYCMATFINRNVPKELKASGQTLNAMLCIGLARMAGSVLGGYASDRMGIRQVFLRTSLIDFAAVIVFGAVFLLEFRKTRAEVGALPDGPGGIAG